MNKYTEYLPGHHYNRASITIFLIFVFISKQKSLSPMSKKKRVKFSKYQVFKHTTESKKKNMVGTNPEVQKRKAIQSALNPTYISTSTESPELLFQYTLVTGKPNGE